jgi:hypothetical protein
MSLLPVDATRRSEFSAILKNEGIDGLIAALNRKADVLTGTMAKALWCFRSDRHAGSWRSEVA